MALRIPALGSRAASLILLALFLPGLLPALFAADGWLPISPADFKASAAAPPGADSFILYREEIYNDQANLQSFYFRVMILTDRGRERCSDIEIPYDKSHLTRVSGIRGRTIHPDGSVRLFDGQSFDQLLSRQHGERLFARVFSLAQVQVGDIVEYKYEIHWDDHWLQGANWQVQLGVYQKKAIFRYYPYPFNNAIEGLVNERGDLLSNVSFVSFLPPSVAEPQIKHLADGRSLVDLTVENVPAFEEENYMPPPEQLEYRVRFFYTYGASAKADAGTFWKEAGRSWNRSVEKFIGHPDRLSEAVTHIVNANDTSTTKAQKIYMEVQKLENLSWPNRPTDTVNGSDKPATSAQDVLGQKRGSSASLTRLYVALLRAAGLRAYVMRVGRRDGALFEKDVLDASQLSDEIAIVEVAGKDVYAEPGTKFCPYGMLSWEHASVQGLRQTSSSKVEFAQTPDGSYKESVTQRFADLVLSENGDAVGQVTLQFTGQPALRHRQAMQQADAQQRIHDFEAELSNWLPPGSQITFKEMQNQDDLAKPLVLHFDVTVPRMAVPVGKRMLLPFALFRAPDPRSFSSTTRAHPVYFAFPYSEKDEVTLHLPNGLRAEDIPKAYKDEHSFCGYLIWAANNLENIEFHREFVMADFDIPVKYYSELRSFFAQVATGDEQQTVLGFVDGTVDQTKP